MAAPIKSSRDTLLAHVDGMNPNARAKRTLFADTERIEERSTYWLDWLIFSDNEDALKQAWYDGGIKAVMYLIGRSKSVAYDLVALAGLNRQKWSDEIEAMHEAKYETYVERLSTIWGWVRGRRTLDISTHAFFIGENSRGEERYGIQFPYRTPIRVMIAEGLEWFTAYGKRWDVTDALNYKAYKTTVTILEEDQ